ncbi:hypothetical protein OAE24_05305 [Candidatus Thioglobus sp.]|nr:hypothetical protein [Candidatus Thioglobus sp.]
MTNNNKNCPHCGSSSIMPISYGLKTDEAVEENAREKKWVWGGCVMREDVNGGLKTHYCSDCNESYNEANPFFFTNLSKKNNQSESSNESLFRTPINEDQDNAYDEESFLRDRQVLFDRIDEYLEGERDEELYAKALKEADGDEIEAGHIYYGLFMQSDEDDETK